MKFVLAWSLCAATATAIHPALAQERVRLEGVVVIAGTKVPIALAEISLKTDSAKDGYATRADSVGHFLFGSLPAGLYRISVRRIGYDPIESPINLESGTYDVTLEVASLSYALDSVKIFGETRAERVLTNVGFDERQRRGFGQFIDRKEIKNRRPRDLYALFHPYLHGCTLIYINGRPTSLRTIDVDMVAGFEVYSRRIETPPQFANPAHPDCGSLVVWTMIPPD